MCIQWTCALYFVVMTGQSNVMTVQSNVMTGQSNVMSGQSNPPISIIQ